MLSEQVRTQVFWACLRRALWINVQMFLIVLVSRLLMNVIASVVARVNGVDSAQYASVTVTLSWVLTAVVTLVLMWWYARWLLTAKIGSLQVTFHDGEPTPPNNKLQRTRGAAPERADG
jgi:hypothetical protein